MLPARAALLHIMGMLAGHWPHTLGLQPGGTTRAIGSAEQARLLAMRRDASAAFSRRTLFGDTLERVAALDSTEALDAWAARTAPASSDFRHFLAIVRGAWAGAARPAPGRFMSYGAYTG